MAPRRPHENVAHQAFVHGNTCLMVEKFDEACIAFHLIASEYPRVSSSADVGRQI